MNSRMEGRAARETGTAIDLRLLSSVLDAASDAVEITDARGAIVLVNEAWCRLFNRRKEQVTGKPLDRARLSVMESSEHGRWQRWCIELGETRGSLILGRDDGTYMSVGYTRTLCGGMNGVAVGVTIYRASVEPEMAVGPLEHKMRNLFNVIVNNLELIERVEEDRSIRRRLELMRGAVDSGVELLDGVCRSFDAVDRDVR